ncbi:zinc finger protein ZAT1-like [Malania oleifera]|uniref:zinc finger protein ZAT1-like n=1 Tax=Malania oleifera TaxID=397392 RepID=UPI0025AE3FFC|nr:zinc finger protein ZAT1-like [Malania oleifera]
MDAHKCKLCSRSFASGRALGGHMRSHMATLPIPPKTPQLRDRTDSISSSSSSSEEDERNREEAEEKNREGEEKALGYGLRENPKRSFRFADPEFSFAVDTGSVVQDRESEAESPRNPTRQRSKRKRSTAESTPELEPVSSVSDTSPEEDVALCLMMLSRDKWRREVEEEESDLDESKLRRTQGKFRCETCNKTFGSYQALGGHKASHRKTKACAEDEAERGNVVSADLKTHECPFCYKVFGSGQALGGHKRSHILASSTTSNCSKLGLNLIDLNLPAPAEDDQLESSAVSDAEFIKSH